MKYILLLSHSQDFFTIDRVQAALAKRQLTPLRINTDLFPTEIQISQAINQQTCHIHLVSEQISFSPKDVAAVWNRKVWSPKLPNDLDPQFYNGCLNESVKTFRIFLQNLEHVSWLDSIPIVQKANNKFWQLQVAQQVGLNIPPTLITNNPTDLKSFYESHQGEIVAKMNTTLSYGMQSNDFFVYTSKVEKEHLEDADLLKYSPMIFQKMIPKAYELRIIYVNGDCFVGKIDATSSEKGQTDWRQSETNEVRWQPYIVPDDLKDLLRLFMKKMGLLYGAIDVICQPDGQYIFLEVNPGGEWGMIEKYLEEPISEAIADTLKGMVGK